MLYVPPVVAVVELYIAAPAGVVLALVGYFAGCRRERHRYETRRRRTNHVNG